MDGVQCNVLNDFIERKNKYFTTLISVHDVLAAIQAVLQDLDG